MNFNQEETDFISRRVRVLGNVGYNKDLLKNAVMDFRKTFPDSKRDDRSIEGKFYNVRMDVFHRSKRRKHLPISGPKPITDTSFDDLINQFLDITAEIAKRFKTMSVRDQRFREFLEVEKR